MASTTIHTGSSRDESIFSLVTSFVSSFLTPVYADDQESSDDKEESEDKDESEDGENKEEEEDEPEDVLPSILEECENSKGCAAVKHHFDECAKRVNEGKGYEGENCIEEFFHFSHCAQDCTAPKLFKRLV